MNSVYKPLFVFSPCFCQVFVLLIHFDLYSLRYVWFFFEKCCTRPRPPTPKKMQVPHYITPISPHNVRLSTTATFLCLQCSRSGEVRLYHMVAKVSSPNMTSQIPIIRFHSKRGNFWFVFVKISEIVGFSCVQSATVRTKLILKS